MQTKPPLNSTALKPGVHLLHKPIGPSSFAAMRWVVPLGVRSCHGGTLDPFASGLLLVLVEPATQLFDLLHDVPKVYEVTIRWGVETDNGDPTGRVVHRAAADHLTAENIDQAVQRYIGWHDQIPPATSAKRINGERAYERAHRGEAVELPATKVYLHAVEWMEHNLPSSSRVRVTVRGGFYVRALARDLGRALGTAAHIAALHRVSIGPYTDPMPGQIIHAPPLPWLGTRYLNEEEVKRLKQDDSIARSAIEQPACRFAPNFPSGNPYVRGVQGKRFSFILEESDSGLKSNRLLRGGIEVGGPLSGT